jgi:hypothetical protein
MLLLVVLLLIPLSMLCGQAEYAPPLRGPLLVTGTFGELRSNHFHGGLDFRAPVGTPVYAVNDGYVSRIKVSGGGYGQAIYVDHPDGKRSVYGHLEELAPELKDTIRALQYARERFAIDLELNEHDFPVVRGQLIGAVGNRGFSFGPHLHFEIREAAGDVPLNPLSLGYAIADTRRPVLQRVRVYGVGPEKEERTVRTFRLDSRGGLPDTVTVGLPRVTFSFKAFDRQNAMPNRNGIYAAALEVDGREEFAFRYDRIPYDKTEYLNALTDYADWRQNSSWFYRLSAPVPAAVFWASAVDSTDRRGYVDLREGEARRVRIHATDHAGNLSTVEFHVVFRADAAPAPPPAPPRAATYYLLPEDEASIIDTAGLHFALPRGSLYAPLQMSLARLPDTSSDHLSDGFVIGDPSVPLHGRAELAIRPHEPVPDSLWGKAYIGRCSGERYRSVGGQWEPDGSMHTRIGSFGSYALLLDTLPPTVRIERFPTDLRRRSGFSLLIGEESGGGLRFRGTVDGQWVLMEYDAKSGRLYHRFADSPLRPTGKRRRFTLRVADDRGNVRSFERSFLF